MFRRCIRCGDGACECGRRRSRLLAVALAAPRSPRSLPTIGLLEQIAFVGGLRQEQQYRLANQCHIKMGRAACCWSLSCAAGATCLLGPCCSDRTPARAVFSLAALGGVRGCWRCCVGVGWVQKRVWWSRFEWSTGFEFLAVSSMPPAQFRCQLNRQLKSRHHGGPGRTLVYIQRTSSARAVSPPTQRLPIQGPYSDLLIHCDRGVWDLARPSRTH